MQTLTDREHENHRLNQALVDMRDASIQRDLVSARPCTMHHARLPRPAHGRSSLHWVELMHAPPGAGAYLPDALHLLRAMVNACCVERSLQRQASVCKLSP